MHRTFRLFYESLEPVFVLVDSGRGCKSPGYDEFNPTSWGSECAPNKEDWIAVNGGECRKPGKYGNVFWQCSDITLTGPETTDSDGKRYHSEVGLEEHGVFCVAVPMICCICW